MPGRGDRRTVPRAERSEAISERPVCLGHRICASSSLEWPSLARAGSLRCREGWPGHRIVAAGPEEGPGEALHIVLEAGPAGNFVVEVVRMVVRPAS